MAENTLGNNNGRNWSKRIRLRAVVVAAKDVPCHDCGHRFPHYIMEFDHVPERGEKLFKVSGATAKTLTLVLAEIEKCDVVCANCHKTRTYFREYGKDR